MRRIVNQTHVSRIFVKISTREKIFQGTEKIRELLRESHKILDEREDDFTIISQLDMEERNRHQEGCWGYKKRYYSPIFI